MSKSFDESLIHKDDSFKGTAVPELAHTPSPPPSYSHTSAHKNLGSGDSVKTLEGYFDSPELRPEAEPSPIPPPVYATVGRRETQ